MDSKLVFLLLAAVLAIANAQMHDPWGNQQWGQQNPQWGQQDQWGNQQWGQTYNEQQAEAAEQAREQQAEAAEQQAEAAEQAREQQAEAAEQAAEARAEAAEQAAEARAEAAEQAAEAQAEAAERAAEAAEAAAEAAQEAAERRAEQAGFTEPPETPEPTEYEPIEPGYDYPGYGPIPGMINAKGAPVEGAVKGNSGFQISAGKSIGMVIGTVCGVIGITLLAVYVIRKTRASAGVPSPA